MRGEQGDSADLNDKSAKEEGEILLMVAGQEESAEDFVEK